MLTLPGVWLTLIVAIACQFLFGEPRLFDWWTLGICAGIAVLAEVYEFVSSAAGAAKSGGGRSGAIGSILGALGGAILGSFVVPIIGTIVGAVLGAGLGALVAERGIAGRSWSQSYRIGQGAAVGRFAAMIVKTAVAAAVGLALFIAVFVK
jgi:uncharacterized protein YqgC (DUF456 family)